MRASRLNILFGGRLRRLRQANGMIQADLAERLDISVDHLSNLERGQASPSFALVERFAEHFKVDPADFFRDVQTAYPEGVGAEDALLLRSQVFVDCIDPLIIEDLSGVILDVNDEASRVFGWSREELVGASIKMLVPRIHHDLAEEHLARCKRSGKVRNEEVLRLRKNGETFHALVSLTLLRDRADRPVCVASALKDISALKKYEEKLQASLDERECLLREIHHRVRNNLQVVISLLDMSRWRDVPGERREFVKDVRSRLYAMGQVHSLLYESGRLDKISLAEFLRCHVDRLAQDFEASWIRPVFHLEDVRLSIVKAIPLALVFNEMMTNVIRHAYPAQDNGKVVVSLQRTDGERIRLTVADEGRGMPSDWELGAGETLGLTLIKSLVERQLKGTMELRSGPGTSLSVEFDRVACAH